MSPWGQTLRFPMLRILLGVSVNFPLSARCSSPVSSTTSAYSHDDNDGTSESVSDPPQLNVLLYSSCHDLSIFSQQ